MKEDITFNEYIYEQLIVSGRFSRLALARALGVQPASVTRYIDGGQEPSEETLLKLAELIAGEQGADAYWQEFIKLSLLKSKLKAHKQKNEEAEKAYSKALRKIL